MDGRIIGWRNWRFHQNLVTTCRSQQHYKKNLHTLSQGNKKTKRKILVWAPAICVSGLVNPVHMGTVAATGACPQEFRMLCPSCTHQAVHACFFGPVRAFPMRFEGQSGISSWSHLVPHMIPRVRGPFDAIWLLLIIFKFNHNILEHLTKYMDWYACGTLYLS